MASKSPTRLNRWLDAALRIRDREHNPNFSPNAQHIAHESGEKGMMAINDVRRHLSHINKLATEREEVSVLYNGKLIADGMVIPETAEEAQKYRPHRWAPSEGIHFPTSGKDGLFLAQLLRAAKSKALQDRKWMTLVARAKERGLIGSTKQPTLPMK
jgi:hypothetical protein